MVRHHGAVGRSLLSCLEVSRSLLGLAGRMHRELLAEGHSRCTHLARAQDNRRVRGSLLVAYRPCPLNSFAHKTELSWDMRLDQEQASGHCTDRGNQVS